jgi:hypothetical protein
VKRAALPIIIANPATAHAAPGIMSPSPSETAPRINGAAIYVASPNARGNPSAVASKPFGAFSWPRDVKAGP